MHNLPVRAPVRLYVPLSLSMCVSVAFNSSQIGTLCCCCCCCCFCCLSLDVDTSHCSSGLNRGPNRFSPQLLLSLSGSLVLVLIAAPTSMHNREKQKRTRNAPFGNKIKSRKMDTSSLATVRSCYASGYSGSCLSPASSCGRGLGASE